MAEDARTQFVDGLRVTADHLQHLQDRLREAVTDLRRTVGLGRIGWGLHTTTQASNVTVQPGVAFAPSGIRLRLDAPVNLAIPSGNGPWQVVLTGIQGDRQSVRVGGQPTIITLTTTVALVAAAGSPPQLSTDSLAVAVGSQGEGGF